MTGASGVWMGGSEHACKLYVLVLVGQNTCRVRYVDQDSCVCFGEPAQVVDTIHFSSGKTTAHRHEYVL